MYLPEALGRKEDDLSLRTCHSGVRTYHSGGPVPCGCGRGRGRGGVEAPAGTLRMGKQAKGAKQGRGGARVAALLGVAASVLVLAAGALLERTVNTVCELLVGLLEDGLERCALQPDPLLVSLLLRENIKQHLIRY